MGNGAGLGLQLPWGANSKCSRIDLQISVYDQLQSAASRIRAAADMSSQARSTANGRKWKIALVDGHGHGDTLYVGTRGKSERFLRVYDKHAQSGDDDYLGAVRYECEVTGRQAERLFLSVLEQPDNSMHLARLCLAYFAYYGIRIPVSLSEMPGIAAPIEKRQSDDERRLAWLERSVRPAVEELLTSVEPERILAALGLGVPV